MIQDAVKKTRRTQSEVAAERLAVREALKAELRKEIQQDIKREQKRRLEVSAEQMNRLLYGRQ